MFSFDNITNYQEIIGSALGPFLAFYLAKLEFERRSRKEKKDVRKEELRKIEIGTTISLNDIYTLREQMKIFVQRLRVISGEAKIEDKTEYYLSKINFPATKKIYFDINAPIFKTRSSYLHNKLLMIYGNIELLNETISNIKEFYISLIKDNEILITLGAKPLNQRLTYADNLTEFSRVISEFLGRLDKLIRPIVQAKFYNNKLSNKYGFYFLWKQEGVKFRYFKNRNAQFKYTQFPDFIERIDLNIEKDVLKEIRGADNRIS